MGEVHKARDLKLNRLVALKILHPDHSQDPGSRQRFVQEAQAASALNHPNIITIHDIVSDGGLEIMVMEFVKGRTLKEMIPPNGLLLAQTLYYATQIADALVAAHHAAIIHRDLKPSNIMVTDRGLVKLLDFGLAKLLRGPVHDPDETKGAPVTAQGSIVGTFCYMSPEQAQGKPVDARSDIFAFGAVLYEMATGRRAFPGDNNISILSSVLRDEPVPAIQLSPSLPPALSQLMQHCMAKDPVARPQSMDVVRDAIQRIRQQTDSGDTASTPSIETESYPAASPPVSTVRPTLWAGAAVLLLAVPVAWWFIRPKPLTSPAEPVTQERVGNKPSPVAPLSTPAATPDPPAPPPSPAVNDKGLLSIPDGTPLNLELQTEIAANAEPGAPLAFFVSSAVILNGETVIAKGARATGELFSREKKKQFLFAGRGTRINVLLRSVEAPDGAKLKIRATAKREAEPVASIESSGTKPKNVAVAKGAAMLAFTDGPQAVTPTVR